jgi:hypothetical protein
VPIASSTRLAGVNSTSVVVDKAVWNTRKGESGRKESKELVGCHWHVFALHLEAHCHLFSMSSGISRLILVINSQSNTANFFYKRMQRRWAWRYMKSGRPTRMLPLERQYWSGNQGCWQAGNHVNSLCRHVGTMRSINPAASWWIQDRLRAGLIDYVIASFFFGRLHLCL